MPRRESCPAGGTDGSNPAPSSGESTANLTFGAHPVAIAEDAIVIEDGTSHPADIIIMLAGPRAATKAGEVGGI
jgi:hypothetical protein